MLVTVTLACSCPFLSPGGSGAGAARRRSDAATGIDLDAPTEAPEVTGCPALPTLDQVIASAAATNAVVRVLLAVGVPAAPASAAAPAASAPSEASAVTPPAPAAAAPAPQPGADRGATR